MLTCSTGVAVVLVYMTCFINIKKIYKAEQGEKRSLYEKQHTTCKEAEEKL